MVNAFWVAQLMLNNATWLDFVSSDANISDLPSREEWVEYLGLFPHSDWVQTVLPDISSWTAPFSNLAHDMSEHFAAEAA